MTAPKIERCPFPSCGGKCETTVLLDDSWRVDCRQILSCDYSGPRCRTEAEAIAAHNKVALAARLFPEALRTAKLLRGALDQILLESRHILFTEKDRARAEEAAAAFDTLLAEAQGVADAE